MRIIGVLNQPHGCTAKVFHELVDATIWIDKVQHEHISCYDTTKKANRGIPTVLFKSCAENQSCYLIRIPDIGSFSFVFAEDLSLTNIKRNNARSNDKPEPVIVLADGSCDYKRRVLV